MEIIIGTRRTGRTTRLIELAAKDALHIVCRNLPDAKRIAEQAREMDLDIPYPITYERFIRGSMYTRGMKGLLIDDVLDLLRYMNAAPIAAVTIESKMENVVLLGVF
jgi:hypothetical protein